MTGSDVVIATARYLYDICLTDMRAAIEGMGREGLNWRPPAPETNSTAVLASHALGATRAWVCVAVDAAMPIRSRDQEFLAEFESEERALAFLDGMRADTLRILDEAGAVDWQAPPLNQRPGNSGEATHAYAIMHAMEHLREHVGHLQLTRQLWDARGS